MGLERIPHAQGFADKLALQIDLVGFFGSESQARPRGAIGQHLLASHGSTAQSIFTNAFDLSFAASQAGAAIDAPDRPLTPATRS